MCPAWGKKVKTLRSNPSPPRKRYTLSYNWGSCRPLHTVLSVDPKCQQTDFFPNPRNWPGNFREETQMANKHMKSYTHLLVITEVQGTNTGQATYLPGELMAMGWAEVGGNVAGRQSAGSINISNVPLQGPRTSLAVEEQGQGATSNGQMYRPPEPGEGKINASKDQQSQYRMDSTAYFRLSPYAVYVKWLLHGNKVF
jgi:hypothetical protein